MEIHPWPILAVGLLAFDYSIDDGEDQMTPDTIDELLAMTNDFELCNGVFCAIAEVTGNSIDAANEPEPCRTVTLVWHSGGIIGNGGFQYLSLRLTMPSSDNSASSFATIKTHFGNFWSTESRSRNAEPARAR